jgi:NADH:ubiquinone oxidoreductase subunit C
MIRDLTREIDDLSGSQDGDPLVTAGWLAADEWLERARALKQEGWWLVDLCGLDLLGLPRDPGAGRSWRGGGFAEVPERAPSGAPRAGGARFEVVVQLRSHRDRKAQTVHVAAAGDPPAVPSVAGVWAGANFFEREAYDMFGIHFEGHPNLKRILMPDEWEGHPLRKDYGVGKVPVEFVPQALMQVRGPGQAPSGDEAQIELDHLGQVKSAGERTPASQQSLRKSGAEVGEEAG